VNGVIAQALPVAPVLRPLADARREGFVAMFGEKYGDVVRTLSVGSYSRELCGGTHVANSGHIGLFRITSEGAISAGTRRIEAITGPAALQAWRSEQRAIGELAGLLKVAPGEVVARVRGVTDEIKTLRRNLEKATAADVGSYYRDLAAKTEQRGAARTVVFECRGLNAKEMQELLQRASRELSPFAGAILVVGDGEVAVGAAVSDELVAKLKAGDLVRDACKLLGGGGGGRPQLAQGKGTDVGKLADARELLQRKLAEALGA
jgi:alanyl-tRNA synthetase